MSDIARTEDLNVDEVSREKTIVKTSIIGILANVFLAAFKAFVGFTSNSIAIVMDAVNNLSDAASSVITIVGTKLAGKEADRKHPFGYGRIEYISAMGISFLVLYAGITAFIESVKKIISPNRNTIPIRCTMASFSGGTGLPRITSTIPNTSRLPSRPGIGSRFIRPRLMEISTSSSTKT